jgi:hypothetical protein
MKYPPNVTKNAKLQYVYDKTNKVNDYMVSESTPSKATTKLQQRLSLDQNQHQLALTADIASTVEAYPDRHRSG